MLSDRNFRVLLLAGASLFCVTAFAQAADFTVAPGSDTAAKTISAGDTGTISSGANLNVSGVAITWNPSTTSGVATINNSGTIGGTTRGIDFNTNPTSGAQNFSFNNLTVGSVLTSASDAFRINKDILGGTVAISNAGTITSTGAQQALDFAAITSGATINITNMSGGSINSSGASAIELGGGTFVINNQGNIFTSAAASRGINYKPANLTDLASYTLINGGASNKTALISSTDDALRISAGSLTGANLAAAYNVMVDNFGTITTKSSGSGQALDFNDLVSSAGTVTITNEAGGIITAADADAIRPGNKVTINNSGVIFGQNISAANGNASSSDGIDFQDVGKSGTINNSATGMISGARAGITSKDAVIVNNSGKITGLDGSGLNIDTTTASGTVMVTNNAGGTITGNAVSADGDAIDVDYLANITNSGTIQAIGKDPVAADSLNEALAIGGGTVINNAGGVITSAERAITVDDSNKGNAFGAITIDNAGNINGGNGQAIAITSNLSNTLINRATGFINGSVVMGSGNDAVILYAGSGIGGVLDGGAGTDSLTLAGSGAGFLLNTTVTNFETLAVQGGSWTMYDNEVYANGVTIASGANLILGNNTTAGNLAADVVDNGTLTFNRSDAVTFTNVISGTGGVAVQSHAGLTLTGANSYTGGTVILAGGGLTIGSGGKLGTGTIADAGRLTFATGGTTTIADVITGNATLVVNGGDTLILTNANPFTGSTTINGGATLQLGNGGNSDGTLASAVVFDNGSFVFNRDASVTITGTIAGTGTLTKQGAGTLTLTGSNSYTGTTTIAGGALQIGNGGTTGNLLSVSLVDNGSFVMNRSNAFAFNGVISGSGSVVQAGAGASTLRGINTYTGATLVNAGILDVTGSIASSSGITVASGATLGGTGTVAATAVQTGGILSPGIAAHDVATLTVAGNLIMASGAVYNADITPTAADLVSVSGTAALGGTLNAIFASGDYSAGQMALVTSTGTLSGTFSGLTLNNMPTGYTASLVYDAHDAFIKLASGFAAGGTFNQDAGTANVSGDQTVGGISGTGGTINISGGSLTTDQGSNTTYSGTVAGSGGFTKAGTGALILDGNSAGFTGTTTVSGGTLEVGDASHPNAVLGGTVNVGSGGALGGHGTITGSVANAGATAPGGSIGTLTVGGNYTFASGATLQQEVAANGTADKLVVGGKVSIAGNTGLQLLATDPASAYARVTNYTFITAGAGVSGSFTNVTASSASFTPIVSYGANAVNLTLVRNDISLATLAGTANQAGVGAAVSAAPKSALFAAVAPAPDAAIPASLNSLSGEVHASLANAMLYDGRFLSDAIRAQDAAGDSVHVWGGENYRTNGFDAAGGAAGASGSLLGFAGGADLPVSEGLRVGLALGASSNRLTVAARASDGRASSTWLGGYAAYDLGALGAVASVSHGWNNLATSRSATLAAASETETADYDAGTTTVSGEVRYKLELDGLAAEPFASVNVVRLESDAFQEAGGVAALKGTSASRDVIFTDLGARLTGQYEIKGGLLLPHFSLAWEHAADTVSANPLLAFNTGAAFGVTGAPLSRDALAIETGLGVKLDRIELGVGYEGRVGGNAHEDGLRVSLSSNW